MSDPYFGLRSLSADTTGTTVSTVSSNDSFLSQLEMESVSCMVTKCRISRLRQCPKRA